MVDYMRKLQKGCIFTVFFRQTFKWLRQYNAGKPSHPAAMNDSEAGRAFYFAYWQKSCH